MINKQCKTVESSCHTNITISSNIAELEQPYKFWKPVTGLNHRQFADEKTTKNAGAKNKKKKRPSALVRHNNFKN